MTGAIILARHGEPALTRKLLLSSADYRDWWARYELGGILPGQSPPAALIDAANGAATIATSIRRRAIESANLVAPGRALTSEAVFIEAPLPPPRLPTWIKFSPRMWGFVTRACWWYLNMHAGEESRREAEVRTERAVDRLIELAAAGDVVLLAHGFFNTLLVPIFKRRGWRYGGNDGWKYWSTKRFDPPSPEVGRVDSRAAARGGVGG